MSEAHTQAAAGATTPGAGAGASPEFDREEIAEFGAADGHAVTVIGKMLVGFFFYSLIVMTFVALWTRSSATAPAPVPAAHAIEDEE